MTKPNPTRKERKYVGILGKKNIDSRSIPSNEVWFEIDEARDLSVPTNKPEEICWRCEKPWDGGGEYCSYCGQSYKIPKAPTGKEGYNTKVTHKGRGITQSEDSVTGKEGWEKRFEKFWLELTDTRKWRDGKPVVDGYLYVTTGNAVMQFVKDELQSQKSELIKEIENILKDCTDAFGTTDYKMFAEKVISLLKE